MRIDLPSGSILGGADVVGRGATEPIDGDGDRLFERHHHDRKGDMDAGRHFLVEAEHEARLHGIGADPDFALDPLFGQRAATQR